MATSVIAHGHGVAGDLALQRLQADLGERRVGGDQTVEVGHVGAVVAVVVDRHRGGIDRRL